MSRRFAIRRPTPSGNPTDPAPNIRNRRTLIAICSVCGLVAISLAAWPFIASFSPSETAGESLPHLDIRTLNPGEYAYFDASSNSRWSDNHFLVIRQLDGAFDVFVLQTHKEEFLMPDFNWWGWSGSCTHFSLPLPRGRLLPDGDIRCLDDNPAGDNNDTWRWSYHGRNLKSYFSDLYSPPFVVEDGEVVVWKQR